MPSIFKRLFSSGGAQAAVVQVEEQTPDVTAAEKLLAEEGLGQSPSEPPSEEELKEFLIKNFLEDSSADQMASPQVVFTEPAAAATLSDIIDSSLVEHISEIPASTPSAETTSDASTIPTVPGQDSSPILEAEFTRESLAEIYGMPTGAFVAETASEIQPGPSESERAADSEELIARSLPPTLTEIPEALPPTITDVLETEKEMTAEDPVVIPSMVSAESSEGPARIDASEWALEEALGNHKEWLDSQGAAGKKANLREAKLEGTELISANLRYADLQDANLKAADLLLADLRDACLVRANLQDSCLVGANLEGANLEGASFESAMGLVPRQLAGANLRDASVPAQIMHFEALAEFSRASQASARMFAVVVSASFLSWLMIWKTKDTQLVTDSAIIPFLHSSAAAAALPTAEIYLIAPVLLLCVYLLFQYHLQRLWDAVLELPAVFPDGRILGEKQPRIITGLLRLHFHWMNQDPPSTRLIEKSISAILAYWTVPLVLILFWGRYLTLQEIHGTILQELLVVAAVGIAIYATTQIGRPQERWMASGKRKKSIAEKLRHANPVTVVSILFVVLSFLSIGIIAGVPQGHDRAPQFSSSSIRRWAPAVFSSLGYDPYPDVTEAAVSAKPSNWRGDGTESSEELAAVRGARLNESHFRYAQAYGIFLANAHLWRSDFYGAFLSEADLRGADFGQADLRLAILDRAQMNHTNFDRAQLDGANLSRADLRSANISYSSLVGANLIDARLDGASLYGAHLMSASLIRANMQKADLRDAQLDGANLEHADMQQAYLWSAKLPNARMVNAQLATAIFIDADLRGADLRGAQFNGTVLNGANLQGANLDGADLRGALQLGASQICSAKSRQGALLDDAMQKQVDAQCGGRVSASAPALP
ncbi:MAG TPA: pentapeptide repeat-containing protein [Candidatus Acidoferrales bacterium]|nr:pentapeptide repeat-containing protein [Candidatus Acidoferrales bacterium]